MRLMLRVGRKGVVVLPKALREELGIGEGSAVLAEVRDGSLIIRPFKPRVVRVDRRIIEELLGEEWELEEEKARRTLEEVRG